MSDLKRKADGLQALLDRSAEDRELAANLIEELVNENKLLKASLDLKMDTAGFKETFIRDHFAMKSELEAAKQLEEKLDYLEEENRILKDCETKQQALIEASLYEQTASRQEQAQLEATIVKLQIENQQLKIELETLSDRIKLQAIELEHLTDENKICNSQVVERFQQRVKDFEDGKQEILQEVERTKAENHRMRLQIASKEERIATLEDLLLKERETGGRVTREIPAIEKREEPDSHKFSAQRTTGLYSLEDVRPTKAVSAEDPQRTAHQNLMSSTRQHTSTERKEPAPPNELLIRDESKQRQPAIQHTTTRATTQDQPVHKPPAVAPQTDSLILRRTADSCAPADFSSNSTSFLDSANPPATRKERLEKLRAHNKQLEQQVNTRRYI